MSHRVSLRRTSLVAIAIALAGTAVAACGDDAADASSAAAAAAASGTGGASGTGTGSGGGGGATFPEEHPRIYLNDANRARLTAQLDASSHFATRFRDMVDD